MWCSYVSPCHKFTFWFVDVTDCRARENIHLPADFWNLSYPIPYLSNSRGGEGSVRWWTDGVLLAGHVGAALLFDSLGFLLKRLIWRTSFCEGIRLFDRLGGGIDCSEPSRMYVPGSLLVSSRCTCRFMVLYVPRQERWMGFPSRPGFRFRPFLVRLELKQDMTLHYMTYHKKQRCRVHPSANTRRHPLSPRHLVPSQATAGGHDIKRLPNSRTPKHLRPSHDRRHHHRRQETIKDVSYEAHVYTKARSLTRSNARTAAGGKHAR